MANLQRIEELTNIVQDKPKWLEPHKDFELPQALHLSGQVRWVAENYRNPPTWLVPFLFAVAEALDDAHEEWLEGKVT